jgi:hypothetical protein
MAVCLVMDFVPGDAQKYDGVMEDMRLDGKLPEGARFHAAGPYGDGWRVVDVWDSMERFEAFAQSQIMPLSQKHGFGEPKMRTFEVNQDRPGGGSATKFLQVVTIRGIDRAQVEKVDEQVLPGGKVPDELHEHFNGPVQGGYMVVDTWTSKAARDAFMENQIRPGVEAAGVDAVPEVEDLEVYNTLKSRAAAPA